MHIQFPKNIKGVIDVTAPPYSLDPSGKKDCTQTLCRILDEIVNDTLNGVMETAAELDTMGENAYISYELRKDNGRYNVPFPKRCIEERILYFPNGTYKISDTVTYSAMDILSYQWGVRQMEMASHIHFLGESMEGVIIRLTDHNTAFSYGSKRPMICFCHDQSNVAFTNSFENITLDTGKGNPGAVGLSYFANNTGTVKNVTIRSGDKSGCGYAGFIIEQEIISAGYVRNLTVQGFDYGVRLIPMRHYVTLEDITLIGQRRCGLYVGNTMVSVRNLHFNGSAQGVLSYGPLAQVALIDSDFTAVRPIPQAAVENKLGILFARNIRFDGYGNCLSSPGRYLKTPYIDEFCSGEVQTAFETEKKSLNLPVESCPYEDINITADEWAVVTDYGAKGDGITDDTEAIRRALLSGKHYILFPCGEYRVSETIDIPSTVNRMNFLYGRINTAEPLKSHADCGIFRVAEESSFPICIEQMFNWLDFEGKACLVDHASKRTLHLQNIHTHSGLTYRNSVSGGKVFIENVCSIADGELKKSCPFHFVGQQVWARNINPERCSRQIINDGGSLWVMGFKTEGFSNQGVSFYTVNHGKTEVLGGTVSIGENKPVPIIYNEESDVSFLSITNGYGAYETFPVAVEEIRHGEKRTVTYEVFPKRIMRFYSVPLYVGRRN